MGNRANTTKKYYKNAFVLSKTKLGRINEIIDTRFGQLKASKPIEKSFTAYESKGRKHTLKSLEEVFELDNSVRNRVERFNVVYSEGPLGEDVPNYIRLSYDGDPSEIFGNSIEIEGSSQEFHWLNQTIGELEEQVERTIQSGIIYKIKKIPSSLKMAFFILIVALALLIVVAIVMPGKITSLGIPEKTRDELLALSKNTESSDQKIDLLYRHMLSSLEKKTSPFGVKSAFYNPKLYFIGIPLVIFILSVVYLIMGCYPMHVFEWGDWEIHYRKLVEKRRTVWIVIVMSLIIGILANLFAFGLTDLISNGK